MWHSFLFSRTQATNCIIGVSILDNSNFWEMWAEHTYNTQSQWGCVLQYVPFQEFTRQFNIQRMPNRKAWIKGLWAWSFVGLSMRDSAHSISAFMINPRGWRRPTNRSTFLYFPVNKLIQWIKLRHTFSTMEIFGTVFPITQQEISHWDIVWVVYIKFKPQNFQNFHVTNYQIPIS